MLAGSLLCATPVAQAQRPPADALKRGVPVMVVRPVCPALAPRLPTPTPAQRRQARELAQRGQQSAILGDRIAARDQLRQAALLDPTDPDLAYQLARAYESAGSNPDALREYCRFLAIAPTAPEAAETRERVQTLAPPRPDSSAEPAVVAFRAGIAAYERGQVAAAEAAFGRAIATSPQWPEPYYDRALTRIARGEPVLAVQDLEQYLRLRPEAEDRAAVIARIAALRSATRPSPGSALAVGLIVPGGGQFYTKRPLLGVATLAAAGGSLAWALRSDLVTRTVQQTAVDPFGNPYTFTTTRREMGRPYLTPGLGLTAGIAAAAAMESYFYARRTNAQNSRVSALLLPSDGALALRLTLKP
jgi:tetratricopeptide (TPR) repeat protein